MPARAGRGIGTRGAHRRGRSSGGAHERLRGDTARRAICGECSACCCGARLGSGSGALATSCGCRVAVGGAAARRAARHRRAGCGSRASMRACSASASHAGRQARCPYRALSVPAGSRALMLSYTHGHVVFLSLTCLHLPRAVLATAALCLPGISPLHRVCALWRWIVSGATQDRTASAARACWSRRCRDRGRHGRCSRGRCRSRPALRRRRRRSCSARCGPTPWSCSMRGRS